jgi:hypothetical protein
VPTAAYGRVDRLIPDLARDRESGGDRDAFEEAGEFDRVNPADHRF